MDLFDALGVVPDGGNCLVERRRSPSEIHQDAAPAIGHWPSLAVVATQRVGPTRRMLAARVGPGERKLLARPHWPEQRPFRDIVVDLDRAALEVTGQRHPSTQPAFLAAADSAFADGSL